MSGYAFNQQLLGLRLDQGLSRKQVSQQAHVGAAALFLYEKGYLRPKGKDLAKLESFYGEKLDFSGEKDYPAEAIETEKKPAFTRKKRVLGFGIFSATMALILAVGAGLFGVSTQNDSSFYGSTYASLYHAARDKGKAGTDLATNASYHFLEPPSGRAATILFYDASSFLHFSECRYSVNVVFLEQPEIGSTRLEYRFGGDLLSASNRCYFNFGSVTYGNVISCEALYYGEEVTEIENYQVRVKGEGDFDEEKILMLLNYGLSDAAYYFDEILAEYCENAPSFLHDFLPDREKGRSAAFFAQTAGLSMLFLGLLGLFVGLGFLSSSALSRFHPHQGEIPARKALKELPKDFHAPFVLPDFALAFLTRFLFFSSLLLLAVSFLGKVGVGLPPLFHNEAFLSFLQISFRIAPFLWLWLVCRGTRDGGKILSKAANSFLVFFFLAGMETALIAVTNAWDYDFSELIYGFVPGSVFQVVALLFLVHFFLAFTPKFLEGKKRWAWVLWRCLSLLPLSLLALSVILSNAHLLFIDVAQNIYVSFWFPSSVLPAVIISVLLLYGQYLLRLFFQRRYGKSAPYYLNGDYFALWSNLLAVLVFLLTYFFIQLLQGNEYAYYLGLIQGEWILMLIPFFLLCKSAPQGCDAPKQIES